MLGESFEGQGKDRCTMALPFIRWCLNLSHISASAYEAMRESGIHLPTIRTLSDYTHWVACKPGFSSEVDMFLIKEARVEELNDWQR